MLLIGFVSIVSVVEVICLGVNDYLLKFVDFNLLLKILLGDVEVNLLLEDIKLS